MNKKILVLHTGGTISMQADGTGKVVTNDENPMNHVTVPLEGIQVTALDFFNIPSPHMTPEHMLRLYKKSKPLLRILMESSLPTGPIPLKKQHIS